MTQDYPKPIAPPPELVQQWASEWMQQQSLNRDNYMATHAAQWGADQELEACLEWHRNRGYSRFITLREDRRSKPPSLKEQALAELQISDERGYIKEAAVDTIRRALEALSDD